MTDPIDDLRKMAADLVERGLFTTTKEALIDLEKKTLEAPEMKNNAFIIRMTFAFARDDGQPIRI